MNAAVKVVLAAIGTLMAIATGRFLFAAALGPPQDDSQWVTDGEIYARLFGDERGSR